MATKKINPAIPAKTPYPTGAGMGPSVVRQWKSLSGAEQLARSLENIDASLNILHKGLRTGLTVDVAASASSGPTLVAISPLIGSPGATVNVTLTGAGFSGGSATVATDDADIAVSAVVVVDDTTITATFTIDPAAAEKTANVSVSVGGANTGAVGFTVGLTFPSVLSLSCADASTLPTSDANYHARFANAAGVTQLVISAAVSLGPDAAYPVNAVFKINGPSAPGSVGQLAIPSDNAVVQIGLPNSKTDRVLCPVLADENWTVTVDPGLVEDGGLPSVYSLTSAPFLVAAPLPPGSTDATGAYVDAVVINPQTGLFGFNAYTNLPFDPNPAPGSPNALKPPIKAARWFVQHGHYTTSGNPATFVGGSYVINGKVTADHGGLQVQFSDLQDNVVREPGSNKVLIRVVGWAIPPYKLSDGTINPDNVFRLQNALGSDLAASPTDDTTWAIQHDWSSTVGDSTPGTAAALDLVFDLSTDGLINAYTLDPNTKAPGQTIPLGLWMVLDASHNVTVQTTLSSLFSTIAANSYQIPNSLLRDQSVLTYSTALAAVGYASGVLAANALVDSNVASVSLGKLIAGTTVFAGDAIFSRGSGQPVMRLGNDGMFLYGIGAAGGSGVTPGSAGNPTYSAIGLTSFPYLAVQSTGLFAYSGGSGPATAITGSGITLYSVLNDITKTNLAITSGGIGLYNPLAHFQLTIDAAGGLQARYTAFSGVANTLNSLGMIVQNGNYFHFVTSTGCLIGKGGALSVPATLVEMQASTQYVLIGDPGVGFEVDIVNGNYSTKIKAGGIYLMYSGGTSMQLLNTGLTLYSVDGNTSFPFLSLSTNGVIMQLPSAYFQFGGVGTYAGFPNSFICQHSGSATVITGNQIVTASLELLFLTLDANGVITISGGTTVTAGSAIPGTSDAWIKVTIGSTAYKIPAVLV